MKTRVCSIEDAEAPITEADIVNVPPLIYVAAQPPDDVVFLIPLPGGKYAKAVVDAHALDAVMDTVHETLIEAEANKAEEEANAPAASGDPDATADPLAAADLDDEEEEQPTE